MRASLTIDLDAIARNWRALDALGQAETGAAVKANAYGLGVAPAARALSGAGCRTFFVAEPGEISPLWAALGGRAGARQRIFVFDGAVANQDEILAQGARPVLNTADEAAAAIATAAGQGRRLPCAIRIETGMNRLGATGDEIERILALDGLERLDVEIILSHLACSDDRGHPLNQRQKEGFDAALARLSMIFPDAQASLSATGGALLGPGFAYDLIRPGVGLYGGLPFAAAEPVARLTAPIIRVWRIEAGASSGYGASWTATRRSVLATIPLGYADGLPRALSNCGEARIGGVTVPLIGRVSMDLTVLDVTTLPAPPAIGEHAALLDETLTIDRMAARAGTIGYEILTRLDAAGRCARRYGRIA